MNWLEKAAYLKFTQGISWTQLPAILESEFGREFSFNQVRNALRKHPEYKDKKDESRDTGDIKELITNDLANGERTKQYFIDKFKISNR